MVWFTVWHSNVHFYIHSTFVDKEYHSVQDKGGSTIERGIEREHTKPVWLESAT